VEEVGAEEDTPEEDAKDLNEATGRFSSMVGADLGGSVTLKVPVVTVVVVVGVVVVAMGTVAVVAVVVR
jgi:hypothetical protein